ncbi:MAG: mercuric transporter MerT family protein [Chitinophagaceae bacterium]
MTTTTKNNKSWIAGIFAAIAASLCCITPVLAFLGGASGLASSFSWIEPYRPYLIVATVLIFAFAWYQKLKPQKQVDCDCETDNKKSFWQSKLFLGIVTMIAALLLAFLIMLKCFIQSHNKLKLLWLTKIIFRQFNSTSAEWIVKVVQHTLTVNFQK